MRLVLDINLYQEIYVGRKKKQKHIFNREVKYFHRELVVFVVQVNKAQVNKI